MQSSALLLVAVSISMLHYLLPRWFPQVMDEIVFATAKAMVSEGIPFRGVLFAGLMIKNGKVGHSLD
jgi:phosphoribosylamine--glycine ligase